MDDGSSKKVDLQTNAAVIDRDRKEAPNNKYEYLGDVRTAFIVPKGQIDQVVNESFSNGEVLQDNEPFDGYSTDFDNADYSPYITKEPWYDTPWSMSFRDKAFDQGLNTSYQAITYNNRGFAQGEFKNYEFIVRTLGNDGIALGDTDRAFLIHDSVVYYSEGGRDILENVGEAASHDWVRYRVKYYDDTTLSVEVKNLSEDEVIFRETLDHTYRQNDDYPIPHQLEIEHVRLDSNGNVVDRDASFDSRALLNCDISSIKIDVNPWKGHEDQIAINKSGRGWDYSEPVSGMVAYVEEEDVAVSYTTEGDWEIIDSGRDMSEEAFYNTDWKQGDLESGLKVDNDSLKLDI